MKKTNSVRVIRKKEAFDAFLEYLEDPDYNVACHWVDIAEALGVEDDTLAVWKKYPEAQEAIRKGIKKCLQAMEQAGKKDWKMWESKLKMLGINPPEKQEIKAKITEITISREPRK